MMGMRESEKCFNSGMKNINSQRGNEADYGDMTARHIDKVRQWLEAGESLSCSYGKAVLTWNYYSTLVKEETLIKGFQMIASTASKTGFKHQSTMCRTPPSERG